MRSGALSDALGWTSILCWLGAQFPQVMENIRRQSCDGLALPFLANWLLGDLTNLLGCILTKQLPFQTWLAAYFVSVDFMLFSQYFYYRTPSPKLAPSSYTPHPHPHPHAQHIPHQLHASIHRDSLQHNVIVQTQPQAHPYPQVYAHHPHPPSHPHQPTYPHARLRALESAAANLAVTAGIAASEDVAFEPHHPHRQELVIDVGTPSVGGGGGGGGSVPTSPVRRVVRRSMDELYGHASLVSPHPSHPSHPSQPPSQPPQPPPHPLPPHQQQLNSPSHTHTSFDPSSSAELDADAYGDVEAEAEADEEQDYAPALADSILSFASYASYASDVPHGAAATSSATGTGGGKGGGGGGERRARKSVSWSQSQERTRNSTRAALGGQRSGRERARIPFPGSGSGSGSGASAAMLTSAATAGGRGRTLVRAADLDGDGALDGHGGAEGDVEHGILGMTGVDREMERERDRERERERERERRSSRASRRGASLVFLGVWALFGVGALSGSSSGAGRASGRVGSSGYGRDGREGDVGMGMGKVVGVVPDLHFRRRGRGDADVDAERRRGGEGGRRGGRGRDTMESGVRVHVFPDSSAVVEEPRSPPLQAYDDPSDNAGEYHAVEAAAEVEVEEKEVEAEEEVEAKEEHGPSFERLLGRISAWACTTLYLTSRLPQIWKNYVRKSVDGLSMALFVFAFLGNTFYVMSILTNPALDAPRAEAAAFLRESVPYLLGSGGTLCFDVTIVVQSFLYRTPPSRMPHTPHTSHSRRSTTLSRHRRSLSYAPPPSSSSTTHLPQSQSQSQSQHNPNSPLQQHAQTMDGTGTRVRTRTQSHSNSLSRSRSRSAAARGRGGYPAASMHSSFTQYQQQPQQQPYAHAQPHPTTAYGARLDRSPSPPPLSAPVRGSGSGVGEETEGLLSASGSRSRRRRDSKGFGESGWSDVDDGDGVGG